MSKQPIPCTLLPLLAAVILIAVNVHATPATAHYKRLYKRALAEDTSAVNFIVAGSGKLRLNNMSMQVMRDFVKRFSAAGKTTWYASESCYVGLFATDNATTEVRYDKKGVWLNTIRCYSAAGMPANIKTLAEQTYTDYKVELIKEVQTPGKDGSYFLVYLKNATAIRVICVQNEETTILSDYIRG